MERKRDKDNERQQTFDVYVMNMEKKGLAQ